VQTAIEDNTADLCSALATRICHDVAGLLGTLAGMLEMAAEDAEAAALAGETAGVLAARVRLLRAAWGGGGGPMDAAALAGFAQGLPGIERLQLDFSGLDGELTEAPARLVLCLLLGALPGMPRGGTIRISAAPRGGARLVLSGPGAAWSEGLSAWGDPAVAAQVAAAAPRGMAAPLACLLAARDGWGVRVGAEGSTVTVSRHA
jgi:histidine phosphotransferase ChpT